MSNHSPVIPEELIEESLRHLRVSSPAGRATDNEVQTKIRTLANISLASKTLHRLATPFLYHTFHFDEAEYTDIWRLRSLVTTLLDQPTLADHVRVLYFCGFSLESFDENANHRSPDWRQWTGWIRRLADSLNNVVLPPSARKTVANLLSRGSYGMYALALARMCRQMRILHLGMPDDYDRLLDDMLSAVSSRLRYLDTATATTTTTTNLIPMRELEELKFAGGLCLMGDEGKRHLSSLLLLPTLRSVTTTCVFSTRIPSPLPPDQQLRLTELTLRGRGVGVSGLKTIMSICPALMSLTILWDARENDMDFSTCEKFGDVLRTSGRRLTKLKMWHIGYIEDESVSSLGSLRQLQSLRELSLPLVMLTGTDSDAPENTSMTVASLLPTALEVLEIYGSYRDNIYFRLLALLESAHHTALRRVLLEHATCKFSGIIRDLGWKQESMLGWVRMTKTTKVNSRP